MSAMEHGRGRQRESRTEGGTGVQSATGRDLRIDS